MKNRRKIEILKLAIKPAIMSPVASLIVGALALPALALIPPPNIPASRPLHPAESVMPHHRNYIDPTPGLAWRQYADADDYLYDPHYNWERAEHLAHERHERAEHRWHERTERAARRAQRHVNERAEHLRHECHEHVDRDYD
jgi:hypothetical protein